MPLYTTDALILRTYTLGESDRIVVFLTRDRGKKRGVARPLARCSNPDASFISVGSLKAAAKNDRPMGRPRYSPAGTVICG